MISTRPRSLIVVAAMVIPIASASSSAPAGGFIPAACEWKETAKKIAADAARTDRFGWPLSISGTMMVAGARGDDDRGVDSGSVYVFEQDTGGAFRWGRVAKLTASDAKAGDSFGHSVAISGDRLLVGSLSDDVGPRSGSAYLFERTAEEGIGWKETQQLTSSDVASGDFFGASVSISGDTAIIGAPRRDDSAADSGAAYIFTRDTGGANNWGQLVKLTLTDSSASDRFGSAVSISGDTAVVGAVFTDDAGDNSGSAYVFERNWGGTDNWGQVAKLTASDAAAMDHFGGYLSISGDTIVVGPSRAHEPGGRNAAYVFERDAGGEANWGEVAALSTSEDEFGASVAIDGDTIALGVRSTRNGGAAYVHARNTGGIDAWGAVARLIASDNDVVDLFGASIAINGDTIAIGDHGGDAPDIDAGAAYVFAFGCSECGDGQSEPPEQCDDGNTLPGDGCENTCQATPSVEICNGRDDDDDPDGAIDEIACFRDCSEVDLQGVPVEVGDDTTAEARGDIAWSGSIYGIAWTGEFTSGPEVRLTRFDGAGEKFGNDVVIRQGGEPGRPAVAWNGTGFGVAWADGGRVYFAAVAADSIVAVPAVAISGSASGARDPRLAWSGTAWGLTWTDLRDIAEGDREIYFAALDENGSILTQPVRATTTPGATAWSDVAWNGSAFSFVYQDDTSGNREIFLSTIRSDGTLETPPVQLTDDPAQSEVPRLVWTGDTYAVSWADRRGTSGNHETYFRTFDSLGEPTSPLQPLTDGVAGSVSQRPAWNGRTFAVVWQSNDGPKQIRFGKVAGSGVSMDGAFAVTQTLSDSEFPSLAWAGSGYGLVWTENGALVFHSLFCGSADLDGDGQSFRDGDCNDGDPGVYPGAVETCDGRDNNCNFMVDDADGCNSRCFPDESSYTLTEIDAVGPSAWTGQYWGVTAEDGFRTIARDGQTLSGPSAIPNGCTTPVWSGSEFAIQISRSQLARVTPESEVLLVATDLPAATPDCQVPAWTGRDYMTGHLTIAGLQFDAHMTFVERDGRVGRTMTLPLPLPSGEAPSGFVEAVASSGAAHAIAYCAPVDQEHEATHLLFLGNDGTQLALYRFTGGQERGHCPTTQFEWIGDRFVYAMTDDHKGYIHTFGPDGDPLESVVVPALTPSPDHETWPDHPEDPQAVGVASDLLVIYRRHDGGGPFVLGASPPQERERSFPGPAPSDRYVWTGDSLATLVNLDGQSYIAEVNCGCRDIDADGVDRCEGDCNDVVASIHPGAPETCDGIDNDCDVRFDEFPDCSGFCDHAEPDGWQELMAGLPGARGFDVAWAGDRFGLVWEDPRHGGHEIYFRELGADGVPQGPEIRVSDTGGQASGPSIVAAEDTFAFAWSQLEGATAFEIQAGRLDRIVDTIADVVSLGADEIYQDSDAMILSPPEVAWNGSSLVVTWRHLADDGTPFINGSLVALDDLDVRTGTIGWVGGSTEPMPSPPVSAAFGSTVYTLAIGSVILNLPSTIADPFDFFPSSVGVDTVLPQSLRIAWQHGTQRGAFAWTDEGSKPGERQLRFSTLINYFHQEALLASELSAEAKVSGVAWSGDEYAVIWTDRLDGVTRAWYSRVSIDATAVGEAIEIGAWSDEVSVLSPIWTGEGLAVFVARGEQLLFTTLACDCTTDSDGDGFSGDCGNDCDDTSPSVYPGAPQLCDGANNDCMDPGWPMLPPDEHDNDGDGFRACSGDCDDADATTFGGAPQLCDGINNDCYAASWPDAPFHEADGDGDNYRICAGDCNDGDAAVNPGAVESCNSIDDDCNDIVDDDDHGEDTDGDLVANRCDNCPFDHNESQADFDDDAIGDFCDNCPLERNLSQSDHDNDFEGDFCDLDDGIIYIRFFQSDYVNWQDEDGYAIWNSYRGDLDTLIAAGVYTQLPGSNPLAAQQCGLNDPFVQDVAIPDPWKVAFYLTTGANESESGLGLTGSGIERPSTNPCP